MGRNIFSTKVFPLFPFLQEPLLDVQKSRVCLDLLFFPLSPPPFPSFPTSLWLIECYCFLPIPPRTILTLSLWCRAHNLVRGSPFSSVLPWPQPRFARVGLGVGWWKGPPKGYAVSVPGAVNDRQGSNMRGRKDGATNLR